MTFDFDNIFDYIFGALAVATLAKFLPPIAAVLSIFWTFTRFYEYFKDKTKKKRRREKMRGSRYKD